MDDDEARMADGWKRAACWAFGEFYWACPPAEAAEQLEQMIRRGEFDDVDLGRAPAGGSDRNA
jgi:hypothetical protein